MHSSWGWHVTCEVLLQDDTASIETPAQQQLPKLALGQRVLLQDADVAMGGIAGVVVGWDRQCCEGSSWKNCNSVSQLSKVGPPPQQLRPVFSNPRPSPDHI